YLRQQIGLCVLAARGAQTRQSLFGVVECETRLVARFRFDKNFEGDIAAVAPTSVTRAEALRRDTRRSDHRFSQNAAADIRRPCVALRKLLTGKVACCPRQIFISELGKVFTSSAAFSSFFVVAATASAVRANCSSELVARPIAPYSQFPHGTSQPDNPVLAENSTLGAKISSPSLICVAIAPQKLMDYEV